MNLILFDGVCSLCNGSVNWVIDHDKKNQFYFSTLQSDYGKSVVSKLIPEDGPMKTIILLEDVNGGIEPGSSPFRGAGGVYYRSEAVLRILKELGGIYILGYAFIIIPRFIRDFFYDIVARNRYRWFGKRETCRVPAPELSAKFLD